MNGRPGGWKSAGSVAVSAASRGPAGRARTGQAAFRRGRAAEWLAAWLLRLQGFTILARRWSCPWGEIDLVARRGDLLLFVEVKRRVQPQAALGALGPRQRSRIVQAAECFRRARPDLVALRCRFDLIAIGGRGWPVHVRDAWRP